MSNMSKVLTKEATSIEEAKALIVEELGVPAEKIAFTVLREPSKRVLGLFGGQTATVSRIVYTLVGIAAVWCISLLFRERDAADEA